MLVVVHGSVEYLGPDGEVTARFNAESQEKAGRGYCDRNRLPVPDIFD